MARPQPEEHWPEPSGARGSTDWDSLRYDLEALLRQVENHQLNDARSGRHPSPDAYDADARHRAALKSVQRAVERFTVPHHDYLPHTDLEAAINEIRARTAPQTTDTRRHVPSGHYVPAEDWSEPAPALRRQPAPRQPAQGYFSAPDHQPVPAASGAAIDGLKRLTEAVSGMTGRLERLEADMRATRDASGDIAEIANQVGQLTHVVELLSGAVGEQGQVKRLEVQIADLVRLYADGPKPEIAALSHRIDELSVTVDRLAELQVQEIDRANRDAEGAAALQAEAARIHDSAMRAIEDGVRSIYDRIDTLERTYAVPPEDLDRLTTEMSGVTEALRHSGDTSMLSAIVERLEALSGQIDAMGAGGDSTVTALRDDVDALRDVVGEALEPRFAALESRIDSLTSKVGAGAAPAPSFDELEAQIRQLAQRMDQTGKQLSGLTELYKSGGAQSVAPDYEALAAMVAERTSQEMARLRDGEKSLDQTGLGALEARLSKLFADSQKPDSPGLLADVAENLTRVDDRLIRLEAALETLARAEGPAPVTPQMSPASSRTTFVDPVAAPAPKQSVPTPAADALAARASFSEPAETPRAPRQPQITDDMPRSPSVDAPLIDNELDALVAPVEDWSSIGMDSPARTPAPAAPKGDVPRFDASSVEKPARPKSSFSDEPSGFQPSEDDGAFSPLDEDSFSRLRAGRGHDADDDADNPVDRNTFIAAARRAARGNLEAQQVNEGSQSLIGKALARFQSKSAATPVEPVAPPPFEEPAPEPEMTEIRPGRATLADFPDDEDLPVARKRKFGLGSVLGRHRRTLMLAGAVVATSLLALNLVVQRLAPTETADQAVVSTPSPASMAPASMAPSEGGSSMIDPTPTGSIDPFIQMDYAEPTPMRQVLPSMLANDSLATQAREVGTEIDSTITHSVPPAEPEIEIPEPAPITLDLPPDNLGPIELRQAAADGDPRAQFEIGAIYTEGSAVPQDFKAAATWYERSAAQGFAPAQYRLGNLYEHGSGVAKDLEQARLWYNRAADAGNRMAMHNLASLYAGGELGEQQFAPAAEWFERAAETGMTDSQFNLGMLYARGLGVTQDLKASYKWFALAAEEGDKDAAKARDDIGKSLDPSALTEVRAEIADWHMAPINIPANFAPIGTWSAKFDAGQTITEQAVTENVQKALARLGYDPGSIDGVMGPKTTQAISEFERATGMTPTGLVNPRLLAVLGSQPT